MFKLIKVHAQNLENKKLLGEFYATTKEEVTNDAEIIGMPTDYAVDDGSFVYTHKAELGIYDSTDNGWDFGDEEDTRSLSLSKSSLEKTLTDEEKPVEEEKPIEEDD